MASRGSSKLLVFFKAFNKEWTLSTEMAKSSIARLVFRLCVSTIPLFGLKRRNRPKSIAPGKRRNVSKGCPFTLNNMSEIQKKNEVKLP